MSTFDDYLANWEAGWSYLYREAQSQYATLVQANPDKYKAQVADFEANLQASRRNLNRMYAALPRPAVTEADHQILSAYGAARKRYNDLAVAFYADTRPTTAPSVGFVPLLYIAGLAVGVAAASWGVSQYEYAVNLREHTALQAAELEARVAASKEGRTLQPSTVHPVKPPAPPEGPKSGGWLTLALLATGLGAGAWFLLPQLKKAQTG